MKKTFQGQWKELSTFRRHQPVSDFPFLMRPIGGELYNLGRGGYCLVRQDRDWSDKTSEELDRVMLVFWAMNDQYAELVAGKRRPDEITNQLADFDPPDELLPKFANDWSNEELMKSAKRHRIVPGESACYDKHSFLYRRVGPPGLEMLFAKRRVTKTETPFAIWLIMPCGDDKR